MLMKWYPVLVLMSLPEEKTVLCMYLRSEWATCVTSLELLQREPETPTQVLLSSAQQLQVKQEHVTFNIYLRKAHRNVESQYKRGVWNRQMLHLPYMRIYIKLTMTDFKHRLQGQVTVNIVHNLSSPSSKSSSAHRQNEIHSLALNSWSLDTFFHFFKVVQLHNINNHCQKLRLKLL